MFRVFILHKLSIFESYFWPTFISYLIRNHYTYGFNQQPFLCTIPHTTWLWANDRLANSWSTAVGQHHMVYYNITALWKSRNSDRNVVYAWSNGIVYNSSPGDIIVIIISVAESAEVRLRVSTEIHPMLYNVIYTCKSLWPHA